MGYASKTSQEEKREANKSDRIDLAIYMATTPRDNLPAGVANRWAANLMPRGGKDAEKLRKFMEDPSNPKNEFVLFFESKKEAVDYARALDSLMAGSGVLSNVVITVSEKSKADDEKYTLPPGKKYAHKITLEAEERKTVLPLERGKEIILEKFRAPPEKPDDAFVAEMLKAIKTGDALSGTKESRGVEDLTPKKAVPQEEEKGVARIVKNPFRESYKASDGATVKIFKSEQERQNAWNDLLSNETCTFNVAKRAGRKIERENEILWENMPRNFEGLRVSISKLENGEYEVTISGRKIYTKEDVGKRAGGRG